MIGIYIGAPIDTANGNVAEPFDRITGLLAKSLEGHVIFNPLTAYRNATNAGPLGGAYLIEMNMYALNRSQMAVFLVNDSPSVGLPIEIYECAKQKKPFLVLYAATKEPGLYLKDLVYKGGCLVDLRKPAEDSDPVEIIKQYVKSHVKIF